MTAITQNAATAPVAATGPVRRVEPPLNYKNDLRAIVGADWFVTVALAFVVLFLFIPLAAVFTEALRKGWDVYLEAIREPDALSAIKLTLTAAAIAVPLNLVFVRRRRAIAKFDFRGKNVLLTLIDLLSRSRR